MCSGGEIKRSIDEATYKNECQRMVLYYDWLHSGCCCGCRPSSICAHLQRNAWSKSSACIVVSRITKHPKHKVLCHVSVLLNRPRPRPLQVGLKTENKSRDLTSLQFDRASKHTSYGWMCICLTVTILQHQQPVWRMRSIELVRVVQGVPMKSSPAVSC